MDSPFEILRIEPTDDDAEIERAFRRRVIEVHPDQGGTVEEFRRVHAAYQQLVTGDTSRLTNGHVDVGDDPRANGEATGDEAAGESGEAADAESGPGVEYLNYEVLDDHGWDLGDDDLFEKAAEADLAPEDYGRFTVGPAETLLEAAENNGFAWPYACRGGACANCAVAVVEGELDTSGDHILPSNMLDSDIRLSCMGGPVSDETKVVYNVKHLPGLDELRLPPYPFEQAHVND